MSCDLSICLIDLRPWPFGPPLRGRAERSDAGSQAAHRPPSPVVRTGLATAPVGGLASDHPPCCVM